MNTYHLTDFTTKEVLHTFEASEDNAIQTANDQAAKHQIDLHRRTVCLRNGKFFVSWITPLKRSKPAQ